MKVFISFSGDTSKAVALALRDWLPEVIQSIVPWMSDEDLLKGKRWVEEVGKALESHNAGILCLTPDNLESPWIHFEAGALSKTLTDSAIHGFLFEVGHTDVKRPLSDFNNTEASKPADVLKMLRAINVASEQPLPEDRLEKAFARSWPELEQKLKGIREGLKGQPETQKRPERPLVDVLDELVGSVRRLTNEQSEFITTVRLMGFSPPGAPQGVPSGSLAAESLLGTLGRLYSFKEGDKVVDLRTMRPGVVKSFPQAQGPNAVVIVEIDGKNKFLPANRLVALPTVVENKPDTPSNG